MQTFGMQTPPRSILRTVFTQKANEELPEKNIIYFKIL